MRTVMYYAPERIETNRLIYIGGEHLVGFDGYHHGYYKCRWYEQEKGVMTLEQDDLDHLVSRGLMVLGEIPCEP